MRHLISVLVGLVLGFITYVLLGFGAFDFQIGTGLDSDNIVNLLALLAAGVAYAVLVVPRLSPIGPLLVGLIYFGLGMWLITDVTSFADVMPSDVFGLDNAGIGGGVLLPMLAIPLLMTALSPYRWRRRVAPVAAGALGGPAGPGGPPPYGQPDRPPAFGQQEPPPGYGPPDRPPAFGQQEPPPYGNQQPIGAPYSGPPSYGPPPGSPVGYPDPGQPQYGSQPGYPPEPMNPDVTRRL